VSASISVWENCPFIPQSQLQLRFLFRFIARYTAAHTLDLYSEVAAICRPPLVLPSNEAGSFKKSQTAATGYIISVFKVG